MYEQIETLKRLWRGESITKVNGIEKETAVLPTSPPQKISEKKCHQSSFW
ncbi:MAG: hypothetical protein AAF614_06510 [Chloroflexota bacterium]